MNTEYIISWLDQQKKTNTDATQIEMFTKISELFRFISDELKDQLVEYIYNNYEGEIEDIDEAKDYLDDFYDDSMSDDDAIEQANDLQIAYFTNGPATAYEIIDKALEIYSK